MDYWPTKPRSVASLHLDRKNPRLGRESSNRAPRELIQYLFDHDKALDVAQSIATRGFFANEPLLAVQDSGQYVVVEGNRRLAALKALREPGLLEGSMRRQVERLSRQIADMTDIANVPVTLAPSRRATDRLIAGRHVGTTVLAWRAENRASFILDKLAEGYSNDQLRDQLGFSSADIQAARQTRAIADMARSIELDEDVKAKLDSPRTNVFTTLERVFDSTVGREFLRIQPDADHGMRGSTTRQEFVKAFKKLVTDVALGRESSRTLNKSEDIKKYFKKWPKDDLPAAKKGSFVPSDIITGKSVASTPTATMSPKKRSKIVSSMVIPRAFKLQQGNSRLVDIRRELTHLSRDKFPNAGAVLIRVFLELSAIDYLRRSKRLMPLIDEIEKKQGGKKLPYGTPEMRQLVPVLISLAKEKLPKPQALMVEKAIKYHDSAPFTVSELHGFVHQNDLPSPRDILQFWTRTEPLFKLLLQDDLSGDDK